MTSSALLDRATIRHNLTEFKVRWLAHIEEWKAENRPATESSHDQQFWGDLLDCFGINARDIYLYQRSAKRASTGRTGKIDLFMPGKVIGEAKSLGVNLDNAHNQALDYLLGGTIPNSQLPPYPTSRPCVSRASTATTSAIPQTGTLLLALPRLTSTSSNSRFLPTTRLPSTARKNKHPWKHHA